MEDMYSFKIINNGYRVFRWDVIIYFRNGTEVVDEGIRECPTKGSAKRHGRKICRRLNRRYENAVVYDSREDQ